MDTCASFPCLWNIWKRSRLVTFSVGRFPSERVSRLNTIRISEVMKRAYEQPGVRRKSVPETFSDVYSLIAEKVIVFLLDIRAPRLLIFIAVGRSNGPGRFSPMALPISKSLHGRALLRLAYTWWRWLLECSKWWRRQPTRCRSSPWGASNGRIGETMGWAIGVTRWGGIGRRCS